MLAAARSLPSDSLQVSSVPDAPPAPSAATTRGSETVSRLPALPLHKVTCSRTNHALSFYVSTTLPLSRWSHSATGCTICGSNPGRVKVKVKQSLYKPGQGP